MPTCHATPHVKRQTNTLGVKPPGQQGCRVCTGWPGLKRWEGMLGSYDIQTLVSQAAAHRTGHLSLTTTQLAFSSDQRCYEVKERRGEQPSPRAAAVAFVTFGFGSADNVLLRSLRPSETDDVWPAATELCISCPSVSHVVCANTGNSFLSFTDACHSPIHSTPGKGITSITRPSLACLDHHVLHIITLGTCFFFFFFFIIIVVL